MAAPTPSTRSTPSGTRIKDGFSSKIAMSLDRNINFWEKQVKPPGMNGGDAIKTTTMHNVAVHTKYPRSLIEYENVTTTVAYDPDVYHKIADVINLNQTITVFFPDGTSLCFYGYLQKFTPSDLKEGEYPEAAVEIVVTNWDSTNEVEAIPVLAPHVGT